MTPQRIPASGPALTMASPAAEAQQHLTSINRLVVVQVSRWHAHHILTEPIASLAGPHPSTA